MKTILCVGDVHVEDEISNERATWLGNLIVDRKPTYVVQIGDLGSFRSMSHHEFHKKSSEGQRYGARPAEEVRTVARIHILKAAQVVMWPKRYQWQLEMF